MFDIIIRNGTIFDGSGQERFTADIGINKDSIEQVSDLSGEQGEIEIDATNLFVSPGFVDIANHSDAYLTLIKNNRSESLVRQGITTAIVGHCGSSLAPLASSNLNKTISKWAQAFSTLVVPPHQSFDAIKSIRKWSDIEGVNVGWITVKEYLEQLRDRGLAINYGTIIGHSTIRRALVGDAHRQLSKSELEHLQELLRESLRNGANGISFGLNYAHAYFVEKEELVALAKVAGEEGKRCFFHLRDEHRFIVPAVAEVIAIAKEAQAGAQIVHFKTDNNFKAEFEECLQLIEEANNEGVEINFDFYPYERAWSVLYTLLPDWAYKENREKMLERLHDREQYEAIIDELRQSTRPLEDILISHAPKSPTYVGKTIGSIAESRGISPQEALLDTLKGTGGHVLGLDPYNSEKINELSAVHPLSICASVGAGYDLEDSKEGYLVHPRSFGTFPRFINTYVKEKRLLTYEKAIQKITSIPALKSGIANRGFIAPSMKADITIFDPKTIIDKATYQNPFMFSKGIEHVLVNGQVKVKNNQYMEGFSGEII